MADSRKVAIVTGSATGVGAAAALLLARRGCDVVVNYSKSAVEAAETGRRCTEAGADVLVMQGDVAEDAACRELAQAAFARWGRIDYLINNAARTKFASYSDLEALSAEDFLDIYRVNVVGAYQMARAVLPHMRRAGRGAIVNTSSIGGFTGLSSSMAYAASKAALNVLTKSLAVALGPQVRVNAVAPGAIQTRWMQAAMSPDQHERYLAQAAEAVPLKAVATPEQIAEALVWFLEGASLVTGEVLLVDAGAHCGQLPPPSTSSPGSR